MQIPIKHYAAAWHPVKNAGKVTIVLPNSKPFDLLVDSPAELSALLIILQSGETIFDTETGVVHTNWINK